MLCESRRRRAEAVSVADRLQRPISEPITAAARAPPQRQHRHRARRGGRTGHRRADPGRRRRHVPRQGARRRRAELFDAAMRDRAVEAMTVEQELQRGLERGELRVLLPAVGRPDDSAAWSASRHCCAGSTRSGAAAARRVHPRRRGDRADRRRSGPGSSARPAGGLRVAAPRPSTEATRSRTVNLSACQLTDPALSPPSSACVRNAGMIPPSLCLEVTESTAIAGRDLGFRAVTDNSNMAGVRVAIDDFGTGYSSLDHVRSMGGRAEDRPVVRAGHRARSSVSVSCHGARAGRALGMDVSPRGSRRRRSLVLCELACRSRRATCSPARCRPRSSTSCSKRSCRSESARRVRVRPEP